MNMKYIVLVFSDLLHVNSKGVHYIRRPMSFSHCIIYDNLSLIPFDKL
jgi:hypothetical protein